MLSKRDIQYLREIFITKDEFEKISQQMRSDIAQFKDDILTEIRAMREEIAMLFYRQQEHTHQLENHEGRLMKVDLRGIEPLTSSMP